MLLAPPLEYDQAKERVSVSRKNVSGVKNTDAKIVARLVSIQDRIMRVILPKSPVPQ